MRLGIILVGGGGHCRSCIDVLELAGQYDIVGIVDQFEEKDRIWNYRIIGNDADLPALTEQYRNVLITVGQIKTSTKRIALFEKLKELGAVFPSIISPLAHVSLHSTLGEGTVVMHQALVNSGASIGRNCIINTKALIEHDVVVNDHCHVSTGAIVNGGAAIGQGAFIGSNAVVRQGVRIGANAVVGFGARVTADVAEGEIFK